MKRININYQEFKLLSEVASFIKIRITKPMANAGSKKKGMLIVNTCLMGDFLWTVPSLTMFLAQKKISADMIVTPTVKPLAEKIRGINHVYAASAYKKSTEKQTHAHDMPKSYDQIIIIRTSNAAYKLIKDIEYSKLTTSDVHYFRFFGHMMKNLILNKNVKQWRDVSFEIVGLKPPKKFPSFGQMFKFNAKDKDMIKIFEELRGRQKKIFIHTGSGWSAKLWSNNKWAKLLDTIHRNMNCKFIFVGGTEEEKKSFEYIQKTLNFKIYSFIGRANIKDLILAMRKGDYFIGVDSGPRHLAHLADLRSVNLIGPSIKDYMPLSNEDIVIDKTNPRSTSLFYYGNGMEKIRVKDVLYAFNKLQKNK
jgi:ADP-heptose:LPS heptosyltransferase